MQLTFAGPFFFYSPFYPKPLMSKEDKAQKPSDPELPLDPNDELPPDADLEERFNDFWKRNGAGIFGAIALGAVIVLGVQGYQYAGERAVQAAQAAYQQVETREDRIQFAEDFSKHKIAGVAFLEVADEYFSEKDFGNAAVFYERADKILRDGFFRSRARLGQGISLVLNGQGESGQSLLQAVVNDTSALDQIRAEAAYHLAVIHWESGNFDAVQSSLDIIHSLEMAGFWAFQANDLQDRIPELAMLGSE